MNEIKTPEQIAAEAAASQKEINETIGAAEKAAETVESEAVKTEPKKDPVDVTTWYKPTWKKVAYVAGGLAVIGAAAFGLLKILGGDAGASESSDGE